MNTRATSLFPKRALVLVTMLIALNMPGCTGQGEFSTRDEASVRGAVQEYVKAWRSNDADQVMATLTDDVVLQPHHGVAPVIGAEAVRAWWFPQGAPPTVITKFSVDIEAVAGSDSLAYAWGRSSVAWDYDGRSFSNEGNALSVLKKGKDGVWRIAHQIWNDPPNEVQ